MTEIGEWSYGSYYLLPHIYLLEADDNTDTGFTKRFLGFYDRENFGISNPVYTPGNFIDEKGGTEYPDDKYKDKKAVVLSFKHKPISNYPILRNIGDGHFHQKFIVSSNSIDAYSVMKTDGDNITFFGNLKRDPPYTKTMWNNRQITLVEIEPYGTPDDLKKLLKDARFMSKLLQDNKSFAKDSYEHRNENKLLLARVTGANSTILLLQEIINSLIQNYEIYMKSFIDMQLEVKEKMAIGIKSVEGQYAFNIPWDKVNDDKINKTVEQMKADIRKMNALIEADGILTDGQKQHLFSQVVRILDPEYMQKTLGNMVPKTIDTATGPKIVYNPATQTPTEQAFNYIQEHSSGNVTPQQMIDNIRNLLSQSAVKKEELTPNAAIARIEESPPMIVVDKFGRQQIVNQR